MQRGRAIASHFPRGRAVPNLSQGALGVTNPPFGVRSFRRACEKGAQMFAGLLNVAALQQQEGDTVVCPAETIVQLQRALVVTDRLFRLTGLREGNRHVQQNTGIGGGVSEGQAIRRERSLEVALPLEGQAFVEIVESLRAQIPPSPLTEDALPEAHVRGGFSEQSRTGARRWKGRKIRVGVASRQSGEAGASRQSRQSSRQSPVASRCLPLRRSLRRRRLDGAVCLGS